MRSCSSAERKGSKMIVLRAAILVFALAVLTAAPAAARIDDLPAGLRLSLAAAGSGPRSARRGHRLRRSDRGDRPRRRPRASTRRAISSLLWLGDQTAPRADDGAAGRRWTGRQSTGSTRRPIRRRISRRPIPTIRSDSRDADVEFSRAVARFVTHIASGRIRPTDISQLITLEPERPDIGDGADALVASPASRSRSRQLRATASRNIRR